MKRINIEGASPVFTIEAIVDASEVGLRPGEWPEQLLVEGLPSLPPTVLVLEEHELEREGAVAYQIVGRNDTILGSIYRAHTGTIEVILTVVND